MSGVRNDITARAAACFATYPRYYCREFGGTGAGGRVLSRGSGEDGAAVERELQGRVAGQEGGPMPHDDAMPQADRGRGGRALAVQGTHAVVVPVS